MKGRQRKYLTIRLKKTLKSSCTKTIIITRIGTKSNACLDCLGSIGINSNMTILKLDLRKFEKYLVLKHVRISQKVLNIFLDSRGLYYSKKKTTKYVS